MFSYNLETIGIVSSFVVQNIYSIAIVFDIFTDPNRNNKLLKFPEVTKKYTGSEISIPIYWFILPLIITQYREMLNAVYLFQQSYKRWGNLRISRDNRVRLNQYKEIFVANIVILFIMTIIYMYYAQIGNLDSIKLFYVLLFFIGLALTISNNVTITFISNQIGNTTDGFCVTKK
jgi:hypothetical protein